MKRLIFIILSVCLCVAPSVNSGIVNNSNSEAADSLVIDFHLWDSLAHNMLQIAAGDSVWFTVYYPSGAIAFGDTVLGNSSMITSAQHLSQFEYSIKKNVAAIDGSGKDGVYRWKLIVWDISLNLPTAFSDEFQLYQSVDYNLWADNLTDSLTLVYDSLVKSLDSINDVLDNLQAGVDVASIQSDVITAGTIQANAIGSSEIASDAIGSPELGGSAAREIADSTLNDSLSYQAKLTALPDTTNTNVLKDQNDSTLNAIADANKDNFKADLTPLPDTTNTNAIQDVVDGLHDTLFYIGPRGLGVYLDSTAGNTNTVVGVDGTFNNPVSTIVAAKTVALALGVKRYYFLDQSTFNDAANDLASDHSSWEFIGLGHLTELAFGSQLVTGSRFERMRLSGAMHASGGDVLFVDCIFGAVTANYVGHADNCWLTDTLVLKTANDIQFDNCQSGVSGNNTPTLDLSAGTTTISIRNYSGGIRIMNGTGIDTISIETDGQVIISANNTSLNITLRGMLTPDDSGTTTNLTKDAVFSRRESGEWIWSNIDTLLTVDTSDVGQWLRTASLAGVKAEVWDTLSDSAGNVLIALRDTVAKDSSLFDWLDDSVMVDVSVAQAGLIIKMVDSMWQSLVSARSGVAGSFGDSSLGWGQTAASGGVSDAEMAAIADTVWKKAFATIFLAGSMGDSLSTASYVQGAAGSVDSTLISNLLHRIVWGTARGSGSDSSSQAERDVGVADSLNNMRLTAAVELWNVLFTTGFVAGSMGDSLSNPDFVQADVSALPDTTATNAIEDQNDSTLTAIADANKGNFKADISALPDTTATSAIQDAVDAILPLIGDSVWNSLVADYNGIPLSFGDTLTKILTNVFANLFNPLTDPVTPQDTNVVGDTIARLKDSIPFRADISALPDTSDIFNPLTDPVTPQDTTVSGDTLAVKPDSLVYQGGAAGVTLVGIDSILSANHGLGSWEGVGGGTGPNDLTIFTIDSANGDTLTGISVFVSNLTGTPEASGVTDSQGATTIKLASDTWIVEAATNTTKWAFDDTTYVVSLAFDTVAILGYPVVITPPADPSLSNVHATVKDVVNRGFAGIDVIIQLETTINVTATTPGITIAGVDTVQTDSLGFFEFPTVIRSTTMDDSLKSLYNVRGVFLKRFPVFTVDNLYISTGSIDLTDIIEAQ